MAKQYPRDLKAEICRRIEDGETSAKSEAEKIGTSVTTIKGWVRKYKENPLCFKRPDITAGLKEELQRTNGLIAKARSTIMPNEREMAELGFQRYLELHPDFDHGQLAKEADDVLKELLNIENSIYQEKSQILLSNLIPYYRDNILGTMEDAYPEMREYIRKTMALHDKIRNGACTFEEFLIIESKLSAPVFHTLSFSIMQSSKTRAGAAFEHSLERLLRFIDVKYETQVQEDEGKTITDFIIPSMEQAKTSPTFSAGVECQTTLKDRFRLTLGKNSSSQISYYLATPTGVGIFNKRDDHDITFEKVENIVLNQDVTLIVFPESKEKIRSMLIDNNKAENPRYSVEKSSLLLSRIGTKIITFSEFFTKNIPSLMHYWS